MFFSIFLNRFLSNSISENHFRLPKCQETDFHVEEYSHVELICGKNHTTDKKVDIGEGWKNTQITVICDLSLTIYWQGNVIETKSMVSEQSDDKDVNNNKNKQLLPHFTTITFVKALEPKELGKLWNPLNWDCKEFICGWGSAFINICVTYPINKITFRQMLHNVSPINAIKQVSSEGIFILYRGILPPLCQKTTSVALMFGVYEGSRVPLAEMVPEIPAKILAAMIAGTTEASLAPFERVQTLLQDRKYQQEFTNMKHSFRIIGRDYGFKEYYRGLVPILLRNGPSNVGYFLLRDAAKEKFSKKSSTWYGKMFSEFVCGGLIGGIISTFFYPLNVVKVHLQSKLGGEFQNIYSAINQIYNERGRKLGSFYRGVHLNYTRGFISWGVITVSCETIRRAIY